MWLRAQSIFLLSALPIAFACTSCDCVTEEKVHTDCRNAEATTDTTTAPLHTTRSNVDTRNKEESNVDKPKEEETVKAEPSSAPSYMTREQAKKNFNNPFIVGTAAWQTSMKYWLDAYGELLKNAPKMAEDWYDIFWKPWLNWTPQQERQQDRVKIE